MKLSELQRPSEIYPIVLVEPFGAWKLMSTALLGGVAILTGWGAFSYFQEGWLPVRAIPIFLMSAACCCYVSVLFLVSILNCWRAASHRLWLRIEDKGITFPSGWNGAVRFFGWDEIAEFSIESSGQNSYVTGKYHAKHPEVRRFSYAKKPPEWLGFQLTEDYGQNQKSLLALLNTHLDNYSKKLT